MGCLEQADRNNATAIRSFKSPHDFSTHGVSARACQAVLSSSETGLPKGCSHAECLSRVTAHAPTRVRRFLPESPFPDSDRVRARASKHTC